MRDQFGQDVTLSSYRGTKAVALLFFPYAFSGVCTGEMAGIRDRLDEFLTFDTEVLAISCDPVYSLRAFADQDGLNFPLLSDFWPHGEVSSAYDVFDETKGSPRRSSYVVDRDGRSAGRSTTPSRRGATSTSTCASSTHWCRPPRPVRRPRFVFRGTGLICRGYRPYVEPLVTRDASGSTLFVPGSGSRSLWRACWHLPGQASVAQR